MKPLTPKEKTIRVIQNFAKQFGLSFEVAEQMFFLTLEELAFTELQKWGKTWEKSIRAVYPQIRLSSPAEISINQKSLKPNKKERVPKTLTIKNNQVAVHGKQVDLANLQTDTIKSGYKDVYQNGKGWRAKVRLNPRATWDYLKTWKYPELAAAERWVWREERKDKIFDDPMLFELYETALEQYPGFTHEQALNEAMATAAYMSDNPAYANAVDPTLELIEQIKRAQDEERRVENERLKADQMEARLSKQPH